MCGLWGKAMMDRPTGGTDQEFLLRGPERAVKELREVTKRAVPYLTEEQLTGLVDVSEIVRTLRNSVKGDMA